MAPVPESVSQSISTSSARSLKTLSLRVLQQLLTLGAAGHADGLDALDAEAPDQRAGMAGSSAWRCERRRKQHRGAGQVSVYLQRVGDAGGGSTLGLAVHQTRAVSRGLRRAGPLPQSSCRAGRPPLQYGQSIGPCLSGALRASMPMPYDSPCCSPA